MRQEKEHPNNFRSNLPLIITKGNFYTGQPTRKSAVRKIIQLLHKGKPKDDEKIKCTFHEGNNFGVQS